MKEVVVNNLDSSQRIDKYLLKLFPAMPKNFLYKTFRKKDIKVNGHWVRENYLLLENDVINIYISDDKLLEFQKSEQSLKKINFPYEIIYEDENLLFVNKPAGVLVHGDQNEKSNTLINQVLNYLYFKGEYDPNLSTFKPALIHRLDRNTSGITMFAKNYRSLEEMLSLLNDKTLLEKTYLALIKGKLHQEGVVTINLVKNASENKMYVDNREYAKEASTFFKTLKTFRNYSLVEATLLTGRTHQIRVTLAHLHNPILGDEKYGDFALNKKFKNLYKLEYQFLHAYSLSLGKINGYLSYLSKQKFIAKLPLNKAKIIEELEEKTCKSQ